MKTVTITIDIEEAEAMLRRAANDAARYGGYVDYIGRKTWDAPVRAMGETFDKAKERWRDRFLRAKRLVEAFGVDYEPTTEEETLTVRYPQKNQKVQLRTIPGLGKIRELSGGEPDYSKPIPAWRGGVHASACEAAADRVVRAWKATL